MNDESFIVFVRSVIIDCFSSSFFLFSLQPENPPPFQKKRQKTKTTSQPVPTDDALRRSRRTRPPPSGDDLMKFSRARPRPPNPPLPSPLIVWRVPATDSFFFLFRHGVRRHHHHQHHHHHQPHQHHRPLQILPLPTLDLPRLRTSWRRVFLFFGLKKLY